MTDPKATVPTPTTPKPKATVPKAIIPKPKATNRDQELQMARQLNRELKFVHGDFSGELFHLMFMADKTEIKVNLTRNAITFTSHTVWEIKQLLKEKQFESLLSQLFDFAQDLNHVTHSVSYSTK
jgi:hypothetical protein